MDEEKREALDISNILIMMTWKYKGVMSDKEIEALKAAAGLLRDEL